jgi:hypothetical protein
MCPTHREIWRGHLAPLPVAAHCAHPDAQEGGYVGGRPPLVIQVGLGSHWPIVSDADTLWRL